MHAGWILVLVALMQPDDLRTRKTGSDWPGFRGPHRDGKSTERGPLVTWPATGPRIVWQRKLGESFGTVSVQLGRLFHFDRFGGSARLTCMKSETGEELWRFEYPTDYVDMFGDNNGPRCCPVADGDRVYVFGPGGMLHCVGTAKGRLIWKVDTGKQFGVMPNFFGVGSTPLVEGDLLIVQVGGSPAGSPPMTSGETKGNGSGIVAFDKRTGKVKYRLSDELASYASPVSATIGGRRWCFVFARGGLVGFDPATGKRDFHYPWRATMLQSVNVATPVVSDDRVFVTEAYTIGGLLLKVRPGGFDVVWKDGRKRDRALSSWWNTPVLVDGHLYGSNGMGSGDLRCVELATGKVKWTAGGPGQCSLIHVDGHFIGLSVDGTLRLSKVNDERYEEISKVELKSRDGESLLKSPARAAPILSHGLLYVRGADRLVCLEVIRP